MWFRGGFSEYVTNPEKAQEGIYILGMVHLAFFVNYLKETGEEANDIGRNFLKYSSEEFLKEILGKITDEIYRLFDESLWNFYVRIFERMSQVLSEKVSNYVPGLTFGEISRETHK